MELLILTVNRGPLHQLFKFYQFYAFTNVCSRKDLFKNDKQPKDSICDLTPKIHWTKQVKLTSNSLTHACNNPLCISKTTQRWQSWTININSMDTMAKSPSQWHTVWICQSWARQDLNMDFTNQKEKKNLTLDACFKKHFILWVYLLSSLSQQK